MRLVDISQDQAAMEIGIVPPMPTQPSTSPQTNPQSGQTLQQTDPAQAAAMARDQQERKRNIQDQIRQTEQQLIQLRKQLAELS